MAADLSLSLDAIAARAAALPAPHDRILLAGHVRLVEIGAFEHERGRQQRLRFDIAVAVAPVAAGDDVDRILSYDSILAAIDGALEGSRFALLETLAEGLAQRLLSHPLACAVVVRIAKLDLGPHALGVEIERHRGARHPAAAAAGAAAPAPPLRVPVALAAPGEAAGVAAPCLVVPRFPPGPRPRAHSPAAQREIDLLALDQAAWLLAETLPGAGVAGSVAEIVHLLRSGRTAVWAPARIARDAVPGPADPAALAAFIGARIAGTPDGTAPCPLAAGPTLA